MATIFWLSLSIFAQITAAAAVASVALLLLGTWILVVLHVLIVAKAFQRHWFASRGSFTVNYYLSSTGTGTGAGMSAQDLDKLPCFPFHGDGDGDCDGDCAVCLESFRRGEKCRMLPDCKHSFHARCIDAWLLMTPLCPICRTNAGAACVAAAAAAVPRA